MFDKTKTFTPVKTPEPTCGDWVFLASLNENMLDKEHNLTNHRMTWMMTSQGFLFGAFFILFTSSRSTQHTSQILMTWIPIFGLVVVVIAGFGILAAQNVIRNLERERSVYRDILSKLFSYPEMPDVGCRRTGQLWWSRIGGVWPPRIMALCIALAWLTILLCRFAVSFGLVDRGY